MLRRIGFFLLLAVIAGLWLAVGSAPSVQAQQYPSVANLAPFSAEANFVSLPGYLRWLVYQDQKTWISREEAARVVADQGAGM